MTSSHDSQTWGVSAPIYELLLAHCPPLKFQPPWDFLQAPPHCRGAVANPTAVLAELRARHEDATLQAAGVLTTSDEEAPQLSALVAAPDAALIALPDPGHSPLKGILHARGCLPRQQLALDLALQDRWTREALMDHDVLFATPLIREVALLQALGLPATLSLDLDRLTLSGLTELNAILKKNAPCFSSSRSLLALVGWSPLSLAAQPSPALLPTVKHLTQARKYLKINLSGVRIWRLRADDLDNLRFRLKFRNTGLIRELFGESVHSLEDISTLLPREDAATRAEGRPAVLP